MWGKRRKAKRTRAWGFKSAVKEALSKRRLATRKKSVARVTRLKPRNVKRHLRPPSKNGSRNMREEKRDWEIGESNPFSKTPIERWEADICATKLSRQLEEEGCNATCEERSGQAEYSGLGDSALETRPWSKPLPTTGLGALHGRRVMPGWRSWYPMSSCVKSDGLALAPSTRRWR